MKLTLLGTGSPEAHAPRASSGYLIETESDRLLFDCGGGVFDRLVQSGRMPSDLTHLIFSHLHSDHMIDYARLIHARWDEGGTDLPVFGPAPITEITDRLFGPSGALAFDLTARCDLPQSQKVWQARGGTLPRPWPAPKVTEIAAGFDLDGTDWHLRAINVPHAQPFLTCLGFRIEAQGKSIVYAGDSGHSPELEELIQNADLLIHWCYRLSHEPLPDPSFAETSVGHIETAAMAERAGVKHLILTHWRVQHDTDATKARVREEVSNAFSGRFDIAEDLMEVTL